MLERSAQCDIDDYLNEYYIDSVMKCGLISIVPGVMTGLGILGTFIGLSFGLQNFNTGSASIITDSIPPVDEWYQDRVPHIYLWYGIFFGI